MKFDFGRGGRDLEEVLDVVDLRCSGDDVVRYQGQRARPAPAKNLLRPVQQTASK